MSVCKTSPTITPTISLTLSLFFLFPNNDGKIWTSTNTHNTQIAPPSLSDLTHTILLLLLSSLVDSAFNFSHKNNEDLIYSGEVFKWLTDDLKIDLMDLKNILGALQTKQFTSSD